MNSNFKRIGAGVASVIAGTALILTPIGADAGVGTHVEHLCLGTAFDVGLLPCTAADEVDCRLPAAVGTGHGLVDVAT